MLSLKEQNDFLFSVRRQESARDRALALVLFYTGIKISDCAQLNAADFMVVNDSMVNDPTASNSMARNLIVNDSINSGNKLSGNDGLAYLCLNDRVPGFVTKIPLNSQTTLALKQWLKERRNFVGGAAENALWLTKDGERLSLSGITFILKRIGWQAHIALSAEILRRTWLSNAGNHFDKDELATKFGDYISAATIKRYGVLLPAG